MKRSLVIMFLGLTLFFSVEIYLHEFKPSLVEPDSELGWKLKSNFNKNYTQYTRGGEKYQVHFETNEFGFRTYGDNNALSKRILVLGDSYTADAFTSNKDSWFSVFAKKIERERGLPENAITVWAGGAGGYGSLQEYLLSKRVKNHFTPDLLILQFCNNDFTDNHKNWEESTILRQLYLRRPFLNLDGEIEFSNSMIASIYRSYIFSHSRLLNKIDSYINGLEYMLYGGYGKKMAMSQQNKYKTESNELTGVILKKLSAQFPGIPKIAINCSMDNDGNWMHLANAAGFKPFAKPSEAIEKSIKAGGDLLHSDGGHWNVSGNALIGSTLFDELQKTKIIDTFLNKPKK